MRKKFVHFRSGFIMLIIEPRLPQRVGDWYRVDDAHLGQISKMRSVINDDIESFGSSFASDPA
jgi:hypothetical protein